MLLRGIAMRILSSADAAESILQETLLEFWKRAKPEEQIEPAAPARLVLGIRESSVRKLRETGNIPALRSMRGRTRLLEEWLPRCEEIALVNRRQKLLSLLLHQLPAG